MTAEHKNLLRQGIPITQRVTGFLSDCFLQLDLINLMQKNKQKQFVGFLISNEIYSLKRHFLGF